MNEQEKKVGTVGTAASSELLIHDVLRHTPHRYPFLLVDRVISIGDDYSIVARKNVTINEPFFQGHFPKKPIFPGVLMIEAMGQACSVLGFYKEKLDPSQYVILFIGTDKARFRRQVIPGDVLDIHAKLITKRRGFWTFDAYIEVDGNLTCEANILCTHQKITE